MTDVKEFQALDTTVVQVRSLLNFMYALGYTLDRQSKTGRFVTDVRTHNGNRHLSAATAIKMHNLRPEEWNVDESGEVVTPSCVQLKAGFTAIGVRLAMASKLVEMVKLSVSKNGTVITQDVMVKPLNMAILDLVEPAEPVEPA